MTIKAEIKNLKEKLSLNAQDSANLSKKEEGAGGEIQLTDALAKTIDTISFHGMRFEGRRFDCGSKLGFLEAQIAHALARDDLNHGTRNILKKYK